jgi:hypothetical protein
MLLQSVDGSFELGLIPAYPAVAHPVVPAAAHLVLPAACQIRLAAAHPVLPAAALPALRRGPSGGVPDGMRCTNS